MSALHDRDGWIWLDGELVPWRSAQCHVLTHGLHYATGVFEGIRAYAGTPFRLQAHMARLAASARVLGFELPFSRHELEDAVHASLRANAAADAYVRPIAWRGSENLGILAPETRIHVAVATWPWPAIFAATAKESGIALKTASWRRPPAQAAPVRAKASGLYLLCALARQEAAAAGFDDALMLDSDGAVAEATGANIFFVEAGALHTPRPDVVLDGITRRTVIDLARELGIPVHEGRLSPAVLARAEEVFLTGTAYEVQPVAAIDDRSYAIGAVTRRLQAAYDALVRSEAGTAAGAAG